MHFRLALLLGLLSVAQTVFPVRAQTAEVPVVCAMMFWVAGCPHCEDVIQNVLPPLYEKYGAQFDLLMLEVGGTQDIDTLYRVAQSYHIPKEQTGVPFLIIGDQILVGSDQVREQLPTSIDDYLTRDGVDWPVIPNLNEFLIQTTPAPQFPPTPSGAVVRAILFTTLECRDCQLTTGQVLWSLEEQYGEQFEVQTVDVVTPADVEYLYQVAANFGVPREMVDEPLLIIGDQVLMGEDIPARLPGLVDDFMQTGGIDFPSLPPRLHVTSTPVPTPPSPAETEAGAPAAVHSNGFALAIGIMILMVAALIYSLLAFALGKTFSLPDWADWFIPVLIVIGIGVAAYLSYIETQAVEAMCGPVGDCNTVQQSRFAKLFDILPIGVLGLLGYLALLTTWLVRKLTRRLEKPAATGFWGMAFFAVIFSLYLTYLEPFVIKAVCIWCLTSAVIVTLLLLLGTPPALRQFAISDEDE